MSQVTNFPLIGAGILALLGAVLHVAIIVGGPDWYRFFGAPDRLAQMAAEGYWYPVVACLGIASVLLVWSVYAFAGAGLIPALPLNRTMLCLIATVLIVRGLMFVPLAMWRPELLGVLTNSRGVDAFLVITSVLCLLVGLGYAIGAQHAWSTLGAQGKW